MRTSSAKQDRGYTPGALWEGGKHRGGVQWSAYNERTEGLFRGAKYSAGDAAASRRQSVFPLMLRGEVVNACLRQYDRIQIRGDQLGVDNLNRRSVSRLLGELGRVDEGNASGEEPIADQTQDVV
nr:hypothetical protein Iba_chr07fCG12080 [Ipomoea batatas]